jgi:hypothetical protein
MVFADWSKAIPILKARTGSYCHFCEMRVTNGLAIEHIKPKKHFPRLADHWDNFLLTCCYCNAHKGEEIPLSPYRKQYVWPHINNTLLVFKYSSHLPFISTDHLQDNELKIRAQRMIDLYGLNQEIKANGEPDSRWIEKCSALKDAIDCYLEFAENKITVDCIVRIAVKVGFFSIWLAVFSNIAVVIKALIENEAFRLKEMNCYNQQLEFSPRNANDV